MSNISKALTIGQVAETIGVSTHTLRCYEQAGLIRAVGRTKRRGIGCIRRPISTGCSS
jgi:hypothetical protein